MVTEAPEATTEKAEKDFAAVSITMPIPMREAIDAEAKNQNIGTAQLCRRVLADYIGHDVSVFERRTRSRVKYQSEEEAEKAKKDAAAKRVALIQSLLAKYKAGEIDIDEEEIEERAEKHVPRQRKSSK